MMSSCKSGRKFERWQTKDSMFGKESSTGRVQVLKMTTFTNQRSTLPIVVLTTHCHSVSPLLNELICRKQEVDFQDARGCTYSLFMIIILILTGLKPNSKYFRKIRCFYISATVIIVIVTTITVITIVVAVFQLFYEYIFLLQGIFYSQLAHKMSPVFLMHSFITQKVVLESGWCKCRSMGMQIRFLTQSTSTPDEIYEYKFCDLKLHYPQITSN